MRPLALGALALFGLAQSLAQSGGPSLTALCSSPARALCVLYPSDWKKASLRVDRSAGQEKITAIYAYHPASTGTGFAEGFDASASAPHTGASLKSAMQGDIDALGEVGSEVTYSKLGPDWYVISGTDFRGNVFYDKVVENGKYHKELNVLYPAQSAKYWQGFLSRMTLGFK